MTQPFHIRNIFSKTPPGRMNVVRCALGVDCFDARRSTLDARTRPSSILHFLKWLIIGGSPQVRLTNQDLDSKRRRLALSVGSVLLIVLMVSGILGLYRRREILRQNRLSNFHSRADWIISQAEQMSSLSPARAAELVESERSSLQAEAEKSSDKKLIGSLNQLISDLESAKRRVSRVVEVTPELYLSLDLIRPATSGRSLAAADKLAVLGSDNVVLLISMTGRSGETVAGGDLIKNAIDAAISSDKVFVLNSDNIVEIDPAKKTSAVVITDENDAWQDPFRLSSFGGSLFVFDKDNSEIYKFPAIEAGGYGSRRRWLAPGISPDFSDVIDMAIDGDIWLLHQDGRLSRFRRGAPAGFKPSGSPAELSSLQAISVPTDGSRVWILDNSSRVVAFDKESADYAGLWEFSDLQVSDLAVSEQLGKIFLLSGENIYFIRINSN